MKKLTNEEVKMFLNTKDLEWDGVYINSFTPLNCKCKICNRECHPRYSNLKNQSLGCKWCADKKKAHTKEEVQKRLDERNLYEWDGIYVDCKSPLNCKCKICDSKCSPSFGDLKNHGGCQICAKENRKNTWIKNLGTTSPLKSKEVQNKIKKTMLEKYGVENLFFSTEFQKIIHELSKQACIERFGVEYPLQNEEFRDKAIKALFDKYSVVSMFELKEIQEKSKQTCLEKYGVEYPIQNPEIALKNAKSGNHSYVLFHWKTGQEIVCKGSYEMKVVEDLNRKQIDYLWQSQAFNTPMITKTGKISTYRPDLYLPNCDKWIEIKGYKREDSMKKWEWFHKEYPNSELWDKEKLEEFGIL